MSARMPAAGAPVRRALPARPAEVSAPPQAPGAVGDDKSVFEQVCHQLTVWRESVKSCGAFHSGMEEPALKAMEMAQTGLDAWKCLANPVRRATMEERNSLLNRRADAAVTWLLAMPLLDVRAKIVQQFADLPGIAGSNSRRAAYREQLEQDLKAIEEKLARLRAAHEVLLEARSNKRPIRKDGLDKAITLVHRHQYDCGGALVHSHLARLVTGEGTQAIDAQLFALHQFMIESASAVRDAADELQGGTTDPDKLAAAAGTIERKGELLAALAERFCLAAAQEAERACTSDLWQHALACADAVSVYLSPLLDLAAAIPRADAAASSSSGTLPGVQVPPADDWAVVLPSTSPRPDRTEGKKSRSRTRTKAGGAARRAEGPSGPSQRQAAAAVDPLERAERALAALPLTPAQAQQSGGDPVRIAAALGKDTKAVEQMRRDGHDPLNIAHATRFAMQTWFGTVGALRSVRDELCAGSAPDDARMQRLSGQLGERIEALERIHRRLDADEADALKRHRLPKARHVERLLQLGEIEQVGALQPLRSSNAPPGLGTLFEMAIVPMPLSDGSTSAPLYLHLHTHDAVSTDECRKLPFEQFAAVHVKTAAQKDVGAKWEQVQRALGRLKAKVHRGKVDAQLLQSLRSWPSRQRGPSGSGASSRSLTGA